MENTNSEKFIFNKKLLSIVSNETLCNSRKATEKDLFDTNQQIFDKNTNDSIEKNQKHYGHRKRIKP